VYVFVVPIAVSRPEQATQSVAVVGMRVVASFHRDTSPASQSKISEYSPALVGAFIL